MGGLWVALWEMRAEGVDDTTLSVGVRGPIVSRAKIKLRGSSFFA
jgi:hypothetical protein